MRVSWHRLLHWRSCWYLRFSSVDGTHTLSSVRHATDPGTARWRVQNWGKSKRYRSLHCGLDRCSKFRYSASKKQTKERGQTTSRENLRSRRLQGTCKSYDTTFVCGLGRKTRPSVFTTRAVLNLMQTGWILPGSENPPRNPRPAPPLRLCALLAVGTRYAVDSDVTRSLAMSRMRLLGVADLQVRCDLRCICLPRSWWGWTLDLPTKARWLAERP